MSGNLKGIIDLEIRTDRFVSGGQKAREEALSIMKTQATANDIMGRMAFEERRLLVSTSV